LNKIALPAAVTDATHPALTLYLDNNSMEDLWVALTLGEVRSVYRGHRLLEVSAGSIC
jgi:hypothetical protein